MNKLNACNGHGYHLGQISEGFRSFFPGGRGVGMDQLTIKTPELNVVI
jgi:hypothetical protein